jgi:hypothetical protein
MKDAQMEVRFGVDVLVCFDTPCGRSTTPARILDFGGRVRGVGKNLPSNSTKVVGQVSHLTYNTGMEKNTPSWHSLTPAQTASELSPTPVHRFGEFNKVKGGARVRREHEADVGRLRLAARLDGP